MKPAAALRAPPSIPLMPTCSTAVSSPQSTPVPPQNQAHSSFETPHSTRQISYPATPGSPASTAGSVDSFATLDLSTSSGITPDVSCMTVLKGEGGHVKYHSLLLMMIFPRMGLQRKRRNGRSRKILKNGDTKNSCLEKQQNIGRMEKGGSLNVLVKEGRD